MDLQIPIWRAVLIGTFSHVFLDSMMHKVMPPFTPVNSSNGLLNLMPVSWFYLLCVILDDLGVMVFILKSLWNRGPIKFKK